MTILVLFAEASNLIDAFDSSHAQKSRETVMLLDVDEYERTLAVLLHKFIESDGGIDEEKPLVSHLSKIHYPTCGEEIVAVALALASEETASNVLIANAESVTPKSCASAASYVLGSGIGRSGSIDRFEKILELGVDLEKDGSVLLQQAIRTNDARFVHSLLKSGLDNSLFLRASQEYVEQEKSFVLSAEMKAYLKLISSVVACEVVDPSVTNPAKQLQRRIEKLQAVFTDIAGNRLSSGAIALKIDLFGGAFDARKTWMEQPYVKCLLNSASVAMTMFKPTLDEKLTEKGQERITKAFETSLKQLMVNNGSRIAATPGLSWTKMEKQAATYLDKLPSVVNFVEEIADTIFLPRYLKV